MNIQKNIITTFTDISALSGKPTECKHHVIYGRGLRELADQDGLWIPLTNAEHNMSPKGIINQVHGNPVAEAFSKIIGELAWEREYLSDRLEKYEPNGKEESKEAFRRRYGQNYI